MISRKTKKSLLVVVSIFLIVVAYSVSDLFDAPSNFPIAKTFLVSEGEGIKSVSLRLEDGGYIRSALLFRLFLSGLNRDRSLQLGYYEFVSPLSLPSLVHKVITDGPTYPYGRLTIPEGSTDKEIASLIHKELSNLSEKSILAEIEQQNASGFLFPETYYLVPSMSEEQIIARMQTMFTKKAEILFTQSIDPLNDENKKRILDTVILASILEGEVKSKEDMKIVSGILQKRISIGMALQVDVAPVTYKVRGLPKTPINNPGLVALEAVLHPTPTEYLYYITGKDGKMYYAKTFTEHKKNIQKYLK
jgi:UPF0755 protein